MNINWQVLGHTAVGVIIAVTQALALAMPSNTTVVSDCHVLALVAVVVGTTLGVWQGTQAVMAKKLASLKACPNCGLPPPAHDDNSPTDPPPSPAKAA
jgi:hypothetical protein